MVDEAVHIYYRWRKNWCDSNNIDGDYYRDNAASIRPKMMAEIPDELLEFLYLDTLNIGNDWSDMFIKTVRNEYSDRKLLE